MLAGADGETCWSLVQRAAAGDAASRSRFGRAYLPLIRSFLASRWRTTPLTSDIDDAVQDVFVECFQPDGPLTRADSASGEFRGFLFGIVRNVALRFEKRARQRQTADVDPDAVDATTREERASQAFDREWARTLMREAGELMQRRAEDEPARRRVELLRLRFGDDTPVRDIAEQWQTDLAALHRQYARAREEFRLCLRSVVAFHAVRTEEQLDDECRRLFALLR